VLFQIGGCIEEKIVGYTDLERLQRILPIGIADLELGF
jgi:hypothetical protein